MKKHNEQCRPYIEELDISKTWDNKSMCDLIIKRLKKLKIYRPNILFRGFDGAKTEIVKQHGSDTPQRSTIWCSSEKEFINEYGIDESALDYATYYEDRAALSIYDGDKLTQRKDDLECQYRPKKGTNLKEALLIIFLLK